MDSQGEEFKNYLEKHDVISTITQALVSLYEEPDQPKDPLNYIRKCLGAGEGVDVDSLVRENQELKERLASLTQQFNQIEAKQTQQQQ